MRTLAAITAVLLLAAAIAVLVFAGGEKFFADEERIDFMQPDDVTNPPWLDDRRQEQITSARDLEIFHGFRFRDALLSSGIDFSHKIVDDAGLEWKMVHYDHGNGVSIADVDGDGLYDIYFTTQVGPNQLWRNLGDGSFENMTDYAGVGLENAISVAPSFADIDNDGDPDLYVTTVRFGNRLFENDGTGRFTDISAESGLDYVGHSSGAVFFDYDRDGLLDLFVTNVGSYTTDSLASIEGLTRFDDLDGTYEYYAGYAEDAFTGHLYPERAESSLLFRNVGDNRFVDVTRETGLVDGSWSGDATVLDVNEDGWLDLYVLNMQGNDAVFENMEGKRFRRRTSAYFSATPWGAMGVKSLDYDNDGRMDLYVTDMHSDMWETQQFFDASREKTRPHSASIPPIGHLATDPGTNIFGSALFHNDGGSFTDVAPGTGAETYWPWGVSAGDLNADGYQDLFVASSMNFPYRYAVNAVLLNDRGSRFVNSEFLLGVEPRRNERTAKVWFELDCPEDDDAFCDSYGEPGRFDIWGALGTRSSVVFDLDNDGDQDIVTNDFNSEPMVLVSDLSDEKPSLNFLKIDLVGTESNRDGLGATVRVRSGDMTQTRVADGKSGYLSQSSQPLYFGLGDEDSVASITVDWPSGRNQTVRPGRAMTNDILEIVEPNP